MFSIFYILQWKKKLRRIRSIFDIEKWVWKSEFCCFRPSILKWPKGQKYFDGRFSSSLALLINHKTQVLAKKITLGTLAWLLIYSSELYDRSMYVASFCFQLHATAKSFAKQLTQKNNSHEKLIPYQSDPVQDVSFRLHLCSHLFIYLKVR